MKIGFDLIDMITVCADIAGIKRDELAARVAINEDYLRLLARKAVSEHILSLATKGKKLG